MIALVTGGGGFLGGAIVRLLLEGGHEVRSFSRGDYPALNEASVRTYRGDIADRDAVFQAAEGCDTVFHVAAKPGVWGPYDEYHRINVLGTENVIEACGRHGVPRLVYTSTPSVVFDGKDQEGADERAPYATRFLNHYPRTKAMAEQKVMEANRDSLATTCLRPHLIWGPNDTQLVPRLIERGKAGRLRLVGDGEKKVDAVYVDNAAQAHLDAAEELAGEGKCAGKTYYVTNDEPWPMGRIINGILEAAGVPPVTKHIPLALAYAAGALLEGIYGVLGKKDEPPMTRFVALQLGTAHWYDISAAKKDFGYAPKISMDEGLDLLAQSFRLSQ